MSLEILGIPQFSDEFPEPGDQLETLVPGRPRLEDVEIVVSLQKIIPNSFNVRQRLQDDVHVVIRL